MTDGLQEVSFSDGDGAHVRSQATTRRLDEVLASSEATATRTHHGDLIQSGTLAMESAAGGGSPTQRTVRYRAFGELLEGDPGQVGFVGRPEEVGGMVPLRARVMMPAHGDFSSVDPAGLRPSDPRMADHYAYAAGSPVRFTDPRGWSATPATAQILITAVGSLLGFIWAVGCLAGVGNTNHWTSKADCLAAVLTLFVQTGAGVAVASLLVVIVIAIGIGELWFQGDLGDGGAALLLFAIAVGFGMAPMALGTELIARGVEGFHVGMAVLTAWVLVNLAVAGAHQQLHRARSSGGNS